MLLEFIACKLLSPAFKSALTQRVESTGLESAASADIEAAILLLQAASR
jgi:hypothetical protein